MLSGETSVDGGQLTFAKDVRIALHDQRPPREDGTSLRDYVLGGCAELLALEERLSALEQAMAEGATDDATFDAYGRAQTRSEEHTSELQSRQYLVCRLLLEKQKIY